MIKRYNIESTCGIAYGDENKQGDYCKYEEVVQMLEKLVEYSWSGEGGALCEYINDELELMRLKEISNG